jgi:hypothetical protein
MASHSCNFVFLFIWNIKVLQTKYTFEGEKSLYELFDRITICYSGILQSNESSVTFFTYLYFQSWRTLVSDKSFVRKVGQNYFPTLRRSRRGYIRLGIQMYVNSVRWGRIIISLTDGNPLNSKPNIWHCFQCLTVMGRTVGTTF